MRVTRGGLRASPAAQWLKQSSARREIALFSFVRRQAPNALVRYPDAPTIIGMAVGHRGAVRHQ